jgi:KipI family sensor histidine kinase inhibitor
MQNAGKGLDPMGTRNAGQPPSGQACRWIGDRGLRVVTGKETLARLAALSAHGFTELDDMIPADDSLLLVLRPGARVSAQLWAALAAPLPGALAAMGRCHEIAVEYGGVAGPDLAALAERAGMDRVTYISSHAAVEYTVAFLGFQPGFPYLRGLPEVLRAPRRATPRVRVGVGSVAIGGAYCGIYPAAGPGGWQVIGRTATVLFDPAREVPALLMPGDRVRFVPR